MIRTLGAVNNSSERLDIFETGMMGCNLFKYHDQDHDQRPYYNLPNVSLKVVGNAKGS
jgi:hypothetical protein